MAEGKDTSQEKTEDPTEKRKQDSLKEGQVPRSKELTAMLLLVVGFSTLYASASLVGENIANVMRFNFAFEPEAAFDPELMVVHLVSSLIEATTSLTPFFIALMLISLISPLFLGGVIFSTKSLAPKMNRMSFFSGIKRMFSAKSLVELIKSIGKVGVVGFVAVLIMLSNEAKLLSLGKQSVELAINQSLEILAWAAILLSFSLILIAAIDIPFQIHSNKKKQKMTKQEVKDESKNSDGKPEVKQRIRQLQHEMAERRMMADVPDADVVITNPTHFSVALKYNASKAEAPYVVAKGADEVAIKIREIASANDVENIAAPELCRSIYFTTQLNQQIPAGLYMAVAQVLAYVFQLKRHAEGVGDKPADDPEFEVPSELKRDTEGKAGDVREV